jgi:signal transduction histidine kinase
MISPHSIELDLTIARTRAVLSIVALVSVYVDPTVPHLTPWMTLTGGPFAIDRYALAMFCIHFAYSLAVFVVTARRRALPNLMHATKTLDIIFAVLIATFTEGATSPSYVFFTFAVIAVGCREGFRSTLLVTAASVVLYFGLILLSSAAESWSYLMRPVYLAITAYLIGFLAQERADFENRIATLEAAAERQEIARALHDGYVQSLAGVNLRLESCRELARRNATDEMLLHLTELQAGVAREYDALRVYVRRLADIEPGRTVHQSNEDTRVTLRVDVTTDAALVQQLLHIALEGIRNVVRHADAATANVRIEQDDEGIRVSIEDDGHGFGKQADAPWSIASRVAECGGRIRIHGAARGARLEIDVPAGTRS